MPIPTRAYKVFGKHRHEFPVRWLAVLLLPVVAGCSQSMALSSGATALDTHTKSVVLFTLVVKNDIEPAYGAAPVFVRVKSSRSETTQFRLEGDWEGNGAQWARTWTGISEFPVCLSLEPGKYKISAVKGFGANAFFRWYLDFPLNFPLDLKFDVPPESVVYLGHVVMVNRERAENEDRSGPWMPWLAQSVSGYSRGTMDVSVTDQSGEDMPKFLEKYPCLKGLTIRKAIMTSGEHTKIAVN